MDRRKGVNKKRVLERVNKKQNDEIDRGGTSGGQGKLFHLFPLATGGSSILNF
jgi:hypothetical protein